MSAFEDSDDDAPPEVTTSSLSAATLAALQEHLAEVETEKKTVTEATIPKEDFRLSQFWCVHEAVGCCRVVIPCTPHTQV